MTSSTQEASPVAAAVADLEAQLERTRQELADADAYLEQAEEAKRDKGVQLERGQISEVSYLAARHAYEEAKERVQRKRDTILDIERDIEHTKASEPTIIAGQNRRQNVSNSLGHHSSRLAGCITDLADVFEDGRAANLQLAQIEKELEDLGDPSAGSVLAQVEAPPSLPLDLWVALAPQEAKDAMAVQSQRDELRGRMGLIINSSDPNRFTLATQLQARLTEADRILDALAAGGQPLDTPAPQMTRDAYLGESRTLTQPSGAAHG